MWPMQVVDRRSIAAVRTATVTVIGAVGPLIWLGVPAAGSVVSPRLYTSISVQDSWPCARRCQRFHASPHRMQLHTIRTAKDSREKANKDAAIQTRKWTEACNSDHT